MAASSESSLSIARRYPVYMVGVILQKIAGFALIPLYTAELTTADYGTLELLGNFTALASVVIALGVPGALNKCFHRDCTTEEERRDLVSTTVLFTLACAVLIIALALCGSEFIAREVFARPDWSMYVAISLVTLALTQMSLVPMELFRTLGYAERYVAMSLAQLIVQVAFAVVLLRVYRLGLEAVLIANVAGYAAIQVCTVAFLRRHTRLVFAWRHLKALAAFGLLLAPVALCGWIINVSDRFFLQRLSGDAAVGLYALGYKFGMLIELVLVMPFQRAWNPYYFSIADRPDARVRFSRVLTYYAAFMCLGIGVLTVGAAPVIHLMTHPDFYDSAQVIPYIAASYGLSGLVMCLSTGLIVSGMTRVVTLIAIAGALVNLALNAVLISKLGVLGAAWATMATFAFTATLTGFAVARWYPMPVEAARIGKVVGTTLGLVLVALAIRTSAPLLELVSRTLVVLAAPLVLWAAGFFSPGEIAAIRDTGIRLRTATRWSRAS